MTAAAAFSISSLNLSHLVTVVGQAFEESPTAFQAICAAIALHPGGSIVVFLVLGSAVVSLVRVVRPRKAAGLSR